MTSSAFTSILTVTASTKRRTFSGGKESAPAAYLTSLACTPLAPVDPMIRHQMDFKTPHEVLTAFVDGSNDVQEGDTLVVGSNEYPILGAGDWESPDGEVSFKQLYLEDPKR